MMGVPFVDLSRTPFGMDDAIREAVVRVLGHKKFILGAEVDAFEQAFSESFGGAHVIGVSSGTDALLAILMALDVGPGDGVVTTPFSFFATAGVAARLGARVHLVDVDPVHCELDPAQLEDVDPGGVKVIIPVHLYGHAMDLDPVRAWSGGTVSVLEDAAQAIGARDARGGLAGTLADVAAFSFFPTKTLGAVGDAGMCVTGDDGLAEKLRRVRVHGQTSQYHHAVVGGNFRIDAVQAAALAASLPYMEELVQSRRRNAQGYLERFEAAGLLDGRLVPPAMEAGHTFHQYVVRIPGGRRDAVRETLGNKGVGSAVYYPVPFHLQPCFQEWGYSEGDFPEAERACRETLALPIFPGLTEVEQNQVVEALSEALGEV